MLADFRTLGLVSNQIRHARLHVIEMMAMMKPLSGIVGHEFDVKALHVVHHQCVLQHPSLRPQIGIHQSEKMPMKMHRMRHHTVIPIA